MLEHLRDLAAQRSELRVRDDTCCSDLCELAAATCNAGGYAVHLFYFWLEMPDFAIGTGRCDRVQAGGHHVPPMTRSAGDTAEVFATFLELYIAQS